MKAVVLEKKSGKAIVVDTKGRFHEIKDSDDLIIGQEYERGMTWKVHRRLIAAGISLAMVFTLGTTGYAYTVPVDYVTLDINPSVELGVNMFGTVVDVNNFNEDGTKLTENLDLKGDTVDKALTDLVKEATNQGYLTEDINNSVMVTVATKDEDDAADLQKLAEDAVTKELENEKLPNTEVISQTITKERQQEAKMMGISPGKVLLIQKLKAFNEEVKLEDYANKPVREIMKEINAERKAQKAESKQVKEGITEGTEAATEVKEEAIQQSKDGTEVKQQTTEGKKENKENKKEEKREEKKNSNSVKEVIKEVEGGGNTSTNENTGTQNTSIKQEEKKQEVKETIKEENKTENKKEEKSNNGKGNGNENSENGKGKKDK